MAGVGDVQVVSSALAAVLARHKLDMDDYMVDYVANMIATADVTSVADVQCAIGGMLVSYGLLASEDAAVPVYEDILKELQGDTATAANQDTKSTSPKQQSASKTASKTSGAQSTPADSATAGPGTDTDPTPTLLPQALQIGGGVEKQEKKKTIQLKKRKKKKKKGKKVLDAADHARLRKERLEQDMKEEALEFSTHSILKSRGRVPKDQPKTLRIDCVSISVKGKDLLTDAKLHFVDGHRYGLVGRNGCGKSTLLRRMERRQILNFPDYLYMLHVKQEVEGSDRTVLQTVIDSDVERTSLQTELAALLKAIDEAGSDSANSQGQLDRMNEIYARLDLIEADSAESRALRVLKGLQFTKAQCQAPTAKLSGGWRMRVSLACALFLNPDILMLDEPTNHLDLHAVLWLQHYLTDVYTGTVIVVSHDRQFLNAVCTDIVHLQHKQLKYYVGNFDQFTTIREEKFAMMKTKQEAMDRQRQHMQKTIERIERSVHSKKKKGGDQKKLGQAASRKKKLMRMGLDKTESGKKWKWSEMGDRVGSVTRGVYTGSVSLIEPDEKSTLTFTFEPPPSLGSYGPLVQLKDVSFHYPDSSRMLLRNVNLSLTSKSRVALLAQNGVGKSTLLQVITGVLEPTAGKVEHAHNLQIGHFTQHHVQQLDLSLTPLEHLHELFPGVKESDLRAHLGRFGITGRLAVQTMATLSGGQKSRVVLAAITRKEPQLLILDEPTNHLDYDSIQAFTQALKGFEGGFVLVSHDQSVLETLCTEFLVVHGSKGQGKVAPYPGTFQQYLAEVARDVQRSIDYHQ